MTLKNLKWAAILCFVVAMVILLGGGVYMKKDLAPYPGKVVDTNGNILFQKSDIFAGQNVYQRYGLMDQGAVWGHGSQRGPEFSAATLNIIAEAIGDYFARKDYGKSYSDLDDLQKGLIDVKIAHEVKPNRYDAAKDTLTLTTAQIEGLKRVKQHWSSIFKEGQQRFGFLPDTIADEQQRLQISRFFFWTAWVASTLRPGEDYSYTNNWPPDRRVGNIASTDAYFYSIAGILALFLVLGLFVYLIHRYGLWYGEAKGVALSEKPQR
jgi:nitric oxide reductase subunit B